MNRDNYLEIKPSIIKENIEFLINKFNNYQYYFCVVKGNAYGHYLNNELIKNIIAAGCNYLVVYYLDEALKIRQFNKNIPILCLKEIEDSKIKECINNNITITIKSLEYLKSLTNLENVKTHIRVESGFYGSMSKEELEEIVKLLKEKNAIIEGLYTHIYDEDDTQVIKEQTNYFQETTKNIITEVPIVHIYSSESLLTEEKPEFVNGFRIGSLVYGFTSNCKELKSAFRLISKVSEIKKVPKGTYIGYDKEYITNKETYIASVSIGYANGFGRTLSGNYVYINNKRYPIIGKVCMCEIFIEVDETVQLNDEVIIIKDYNHLKEYAKSANTIPEEIILTIKPDYIIYKEN